MYIEVTPSQACYCYTEPRIPKEYGTGGITMIQISVYIQRLPPTPSTQKEENKVDFSTYGVGSLTLANARGEQRRMARKKRN